MGIFPDTWLSMTVEYGFPISYKMKAFTQIGLIAK